MLTQPHIDPVDGFRNAERARVHGAIVKRMPLPRPIMLAGEVLSERPGARVASARLSDEWRQSNAAARTARFCGG